MTLTKVGTQGLAGAIANAKLGDTIISDPGTLVLGAAGIGRLKASFVKIHVDGVTLRETLVPASGIVQERRIKAMNMMGFAGDYHLLSPTQRASVDAKVKAGVDATEVTAIVKSFLATLPVIRDSRLSDASPVRQAEITYNGKPYEITIHWGSRQGEGILTINTGVCGTEVYGGRWQNGRQEGSSYNGAAIRNHGLSHWIERSVFEDCEDGILAGDALVANPGGDWYFQDVHKGRADKFGYHVDVDCGFDGCGAGGLAHGGYDGPALFDVSIRAIVRRANAGIGIKMHGGGLNLILGLVVIDEGNDLDGLLQGADFDSGACYLINSGVVKASMGTGNYGAPVLMRNQRDPQPAWFKNRLVVKGNTIEYLLPKSGGSVAFVRAINAAAYQSGWPGIPMPIDGIVDGNLFICKTGAPVEKTPYILPAGITRGKNEIIHAGELVREVRVPLPTYKWAPSTLRPNLIDLLHNVDPGQPWESRLMTQSQWPVGPAVPPA